MQQTTAQQLKYYGRRNRAKQKGGRSEHVLSPGSEDASSAHVVEPAASAGVKLQDVIRVSGHPEISQAGKEWASKPVATSEEEVTPGSDVVKRQMPTTRKNSAIKSPANQGREATREATTGKQVSALEGVSAKKTPEKVRNEEMVIVGIASNGGQEQHGKPKKGAVPVCAGARKTRAQLARDEARRLAVEGQPSRESHDVATPSMVAHHRQEALERRRREHQVLAKANAIWSKREFIEANKDKKLQPKSKEPSRSKPHWDFVLEEMTWLAKDFERERKWKLGQAKKVALRVSRSKLDFEAREIRHQKEEEQRVRRVASGIAKEVKKFWMKVEKLVTYKQQLQIEERKKKALDKHLDFLLGQTERYSTMLAANLADPLVVSDRQSIHLLPPGPLEDDAGAAIGEELYLVSQADIPSKDSKVNDKGRNRDRSVNMDLEGDDEDFILNDEEEQEDDEATLEADEALITEAERTEELGALQRESELPMEELLKIYKTKSESMEQDEEETSEGETDNEQEDDGENDNEDEEVDVDDKDLMTTTIRADVAEESWCNTEHAWTVGNEAEELTGSSLNIKDTTNVKSEMEDVKSLRLGLVKAANDDSIADEPAKVYKEKGIITTVPGMKTDSQSLQQNNLKLPHADWVVPGHLAEMDQSQVGGELPTLVVELGVDMREDINISLKARRPQRQRRLLTSSFVHLGIMRDMQDDEDYIPAAPADGQEEVNSEASTTASFFLLSHKASNLHPDDDESTLEEEERQAKEEDTSPENEVDQLRHESEMTLEELLAKYKSFTVEHDQDKEDANDDLDDFLEDRQDRTSEAGTSGSSDEEEDHLDNAHYIAQANARMGEPSTSGRDHPPEVPLRSMRSVNNQHLVETLELKEESLEGSQMVDMHEGKQKSLDVGGREKNVVLGEITPEVGMLGTSLLLQVDGVVDEETSAAVAKVTEAAKRRGERMVLRTSFALKEATAIHLCSNPDMVEKKDSTSVIGTDQVKASASGILRSNDFESVSPTASSDDLPDGRVSLNSNNVKTGLNGELALTSDSVQPSLDESNPTCGNVASLDGVMDVAGLMNDGSPQFKKDCTAILEKQKPGEDQGSSECLADAAAAAQSAQPTGYTYSTTKVRTNLPFLLKHSLREYQHIGLDWLVTMYEKRLNGILADEMGLGKTIMTIALLAHLACEKGIWGPHLIVVPTSVMLNWETEFMKWCPAFKILTYFGSAKERKLKRQGWSRTNSFHVCITTYRLVIQDAKAFKRKKWKYLILDEAHLIKNWKSQRWQTLLNFNSKRRILLTGTPLQNDLMELWSLMHFLMPHVFQSHQEFRDWFSNPITGMVEGQEQVNKELVDRLHNVLRPFLLRRLKKDVEKQLPGKFEHVIHCRLSKRQRNLYEDFMASSDTQETLASGNFLGLINVLMQLRKVCNHPDLFEGRPIISSFDMPGIELHLSSAACSALTLDPLKAVGMESVNGYLSHIEHDMALWEAEEVITMKTPAPIIVELASSGEDTWKQCYTKNKPSKEVRGVIEEIQAILRAKREKQRKERMLAFSTLNDMRCSCCPVYGSDLRKLVEVEHPVHDVHKIKANHSRYLEFSSIVADIVKLPLTRCKWMMDLITAFVFAIPAARAPWPSAWCSHPSSCNSLLRLQFTEQCSQEASMKLVPLRPVVVRRQLFFPDRRLLQFDCGKLQELAVLLRRLKSEGHRALIFTQMTKMLDVLEGFISLYGYTYMRLDGSTKPEQRQILMQRFNTNPKIFLFILSTRSGGVGINLVGADTVIFYDSDWNPAMDQQAQDRCHRIGQTREVHIYRLVSESTIEENILKKANQKRILDDLVIQSGSYNTEFFKKLDPMELFSGLKGVKANGSDGKAIGTAALATAFANNTSAIGVSEQRELSVADVEAALKNAEDEADYMAMKQVEQEEAAENQEFTEEGFAANIDEEDLADDTEEAGRGGVNPGMVQFESMEVAGALRVEQGSVEGLRTTVAEESTFAGTSLLPADVEEDMDMLADVRQMAAAAAAAGREKTSFEDQLRPVERFAMRFLELWDPRAENLAVVAQVAFEEKEWELDQLEKLKEEQEAEMDEENEPLSYENWDTAFANQAYRQQVEVLAQQQENQRQLEWEAMEEELRDADRSIAEAAATVLGAENFSLKSKGKKAKKAKFKSLAEGSLLTAAETEEAIEEYSSDPSYRDSHSDQSHLPHRDPSQRKRMAPKLLEEELLAERHLKKLRREQSNEREVSMEKGKGKKNLSESDLRRSSDDASEFCWPSSTDLEASAVSGELTIPGTRGTAIGGKKKAEGTVSIMGMHPKKGPVVMLEKEKKKDVVKSLEHVPQAAPWVNAEDAVLCAVVHEYGGNWLLASETLAAIPEGGIYRGRHRHPVHCRERFRQLLAQNIAAATGDPSSEKSALHAASNVQLKVTEEHTKRLLDVVQTLPDDELLLPRHFVALLAVVQAQKNVIGQQGPVKPTVPVLVNSPRQQPSVPFTKLHRSYRDEVLIDRLHAGRPNPGQVLAALIESEKSETKVASAHANLRQLMPPPKDLASSIEDESFSIKDFLVGFTDGTAQPSVSGGSERAIVQSERPLVSIEDLLGIPIMFPVHPIPTKAVRHVAELLVDQRYRLATKMGLEGSGNEWAAAAGSLTGVVGVQVPTKSKNVGKKRPAPDPNKPPKPKQPHIPKPGKKKEAPGKSKSSNMASDPQKTMSVMRKKDLSAHNGAAPGSLSTSSAIPGQHPAVPRKLPSTIRKAVLDASVDTGLLGRETPGSPKDLEGVQAPGFVEWPSNPPEGNQNDMTVSKSKKSKISVARPGTEGGEKPPPTKEKRPTTPKKLACATQNRDLDSAASSGIGNGGDSEYLCSSIERRIDLNDLSSSDDDVTITGVIPGGAAGRSEASNAPQSQLQLASSALEGLQPRTAMPRQVVGTESPGIRTLRDEFRSSFLSDEIRYSSLRDGAVGTSLLKKHPQSLGGIGSDLQIGLPLTLRGSLMAPGTVGHTESSSSLASAFGNVSLSTKRSDWPPVSASSGWESFSSLPDFLPMEPSQLQHDPPPLGVWPNPSLVDLESPVQNLRKLSDNVAKRSPSNGAGVIRHEGNQTSGGVSSFQLQCEPAVALGSISPSVVIGSRVADIGAPMIQLRKSTLDNRIQELPDLEMVVNEQHLQSLGNLASRSLPQMQAQSLFSAGFPSASISRGGGNLTQHPLSFALASPQFPFSRSLKIGQQHLYSSGPQNVELPPDFWPSSSVSFPKQQLYNYQHQHSGEALPTFVGAPVVDQEVSIDLGLSLGPGVPEKQPGARLPRDET